MYIWDTYNIIWRWIMVSSRREIWCENPLTTELIWIERKKQMSLFVLAFLWWGASQNFRITLSQNLVSIEEWFGVLTLDHRVNTHINTQTLNIYQTLALGPAMLSLILQYLCEIWTQFGKCCKAPKSRWKLKLA